MFEHIDFTVDPKSRKDSLIHKLYNIFSRQLINKIFNNNKPHQKETNKTDIQLSEDSTSTKLKLDPNSKILIGVNQVIASPSSTKTAYFPKRALHQPIILNTKDLNNQNAIFTENISPQIKSVLPSSAPCLKTYKRKDDEIIKNNDINYNNDKNIHRENATIATSKKSNNFTCIHRDSDNGNSSLLVYTNNIKYNNRQRQTVGNVLDNEKIIRKHIIKTNGKNSAINKCVAKNGSLQNINREPNSNTFFNNNNNNNKYKGNELQPPNCNINYKHFVGSNCNKKLYVSSDSGIKNRVGKTKIYPFTLVDTDGKDFLNNLCGNLIPLSIKMKQDMNNPRNSIPENDNTHVKAKTRKSSKTSITSRDSISAKSPTNAKSLEKISSEKNFKQTHQIDQNGQTPASPDKSSGKYSETNGMEERFRRKSSSASKSGLLKSPTPISRNSDSRLQGLATSYNAYKDPNFKDNSFESITEEEIASLPLAERIKFLPPEHLDYPVDENYGNAFRYSGPWLKNSESMDEDASPSNPNENNTKHQNGPAFSSPTQSKSPNTDYMVRKPSQTSITLASKKISQDQTNQFGGESFKTLAEDKCKISNDHEGRNEHTCCKLLQSYERRIEELERTLLLLKERNHPFLLTANKGSQDSVEMQDISNDTNQAVNIPKQVSQVPSVPKLPVEESENLDKENEKNDDDNVENPVKRESMSVKALTGSVIAGATAFAVANQIHHHNRGSEANQMGFSAESNQNDLTNETKKQPTEDRENSNLANDEESGDITTPQIKTLNVNLMDTQETEQNSGQSDEMNAKDEPNRTSAENDQAIPDNIDINDTSNKEIEPESSSVITDVDSKYNFRKFSLHPLPYSEALNQYDIPDDNTSQEIENGEQTKEEIDNNQRFESNISDNTNQTHFDENVTENKEKEITSEGESQQKVDNFDNLTNENDQSNIKETNSNVGAEGNTTEEQGTNSEAEIDKKVQNSAMLAGGAAVLAGGTAAGIIASKKLKQKHSLPNDGSAITFRDQGQKRFSLHPSAGGSKTMASNGQRQKPISSPFTRSVVTPPISPQQTFEKSRIAEYNPKNNSFKTWVHGRPLILYAPSNFSYQSEMEKYSSLLHHRYNIPPTSDRDLSLEWVYGYQGKRGRNNLHLIGNERECLYYTATIAVILDLKSRRQRHYTQHVEEIKCLTVHPNRIFAATGQCAGLMQPNAILSKPHVRIWNTENLETLNILYHELAFPNAVENNGELVAAIDDSPDHILSIWDWMNESILHIFQTGKSQILDMKFGTKDPASTLYTCGRGHLTQWTFHKQNDEDGNQGDETSPTKSINFEKNGQKNKEEFMGSWLKIHAEYPENVEKPKYVICMDILNNMILTGDSEGNLIVWNADNLRAISIQKQAHPGGIFTLMIYDKGIEEQNETDYPDNNKKLKFPINTSKASMISTQSSDKDKSLHSSRSNSQSVEKASDEELQPKSPNYIGSDGDSIKFRELNNSGLSKKSSEDTDQGETEQQIVATGGKDRIIRTWDISTLELLSQTTRLDEILGAIRVLSPGLDWTKCSQQQTQRSNKRDKKISNQISSPQKSDMIQSNDTDNKTNVDDEQRGVCESLVRNGCNILIGTTKNCILHGNFTDGFNVLVQGHFDAITGLDCHPEKERMVSVDAYGQIKSWDLKRHHCLFYREITESCTCVAFNPTHSNLVGIGMVNGSWIVLDIGPDKQIVCQHTNSADAVTCISYSPGGDYLAMGSRDAKIYVYKVKGQGYRYSPYCHLKGHTSKISAIDWSIPYFNGKKEEKDIPDNENNTAIQTSNADNTKSDNQPIPNMSVESLNNQSNKNSPWYYLRSNSTDGELLFWNIATKEQIVINHMDHAMSGSDTFDSPKSQRSANIGSNSSDFIRDIVWSTQNCTLSFEVLGVRSSILNAKNPHSDGRNISVCTKSHDVNKNIGDNDKTTLKANSTPQQMLFTGNDLGQIALYRYPACPIPQLNKAKVYAGHSSHISGLSCSNTNSYLISSGGKDSTLMQWRIE